jgi:hypothetical protein
MPEHLLWLDRLLGELAGTGDEGAATVQYLHAHRIHLGLHNQPTAARWKLGRAIELHPRYALGPPNAPYAMSLVIHEARHVKQGFLTALSVYGELDAWQAQFRFLKSLDAPLAPTTAQTALIEELLNLPLGWDRSVLGAARQLMRRYAGSRYRVDLLPLYPLDREIVYRIGRRQPAVES